VLDLGCGAGGLLAVLQAQGLNQVEGLDPDPSAVQAARARGLRLREGLIHDAVTHCAGERYDLIVLSHVAEHLRDLHSLPALARLLAPQGRLYIEVPHPGGYACGERPPYYYFDSEHINHFSAQALARLLAPAGLPKPQLDRLQAEVRRALAEDSVRTRLEEATGGEVKASTPADLQATIQSDLKRWTQLVKDANIQKE